MRPLLTFFSRLAFLAFFGFLTFWVFGFLALWLFDLFWLFLPLCLMFFFFFGGGAFFGFWGFLAISTKVYQLLRVTLILSYGSLNCSSAKKALAI